MASITKYEGGTGGKFCKRPLHQVRFAPYGLPPSEARVACQSPQANEARGSEWFSRFVDPAARVLIRSVSRLLSSVFGKYKCIAATPGENICTVEEVPDMKYSPEAGEQGESIIDIKLSICYDGSDTTKKEILSQIDAIVNFEQLLIQKGFSRVESDYLKELQTRTTGPHKETLSEDSNINPCSSHQLANDEKEKGSNAKEQMFNLRRHMNSRLDVNIHEGCCGPPIEMGITYLGSMTQKATPSAVGLESKICHKDKYQFGNKLANVRSASKPALCFPLISKDIQNNYLTQKLRGKSRLHELPCSPYWRSSIMTNLMESRHYKDYNGKPIASLITRHFGHGQALKRSSSDRDVGCLGGARRVRHKSCLKDLSLLTHDNVAPSFFVGQEHKQSINLKGLSNQGFKIPFASGIHAPPPRSVEMAKKILRELD